MAENQDAFQNSLNLHLAKQETTRHLSIPLPPSFRELIQRCEPGRHLKPVCFFVDSHYPHQINRLDTQTFQEENPRTLKRPQEMIILCHQDILNTLRDLLTSGKFQAINQFFVVKFVDREPLEDHYCDLLIRGRRTGLEVKVWSLPASQEPSSQWAIIFHGQRKSEKEKTKQRRKYQR